MKYIRLLILCVITVLVFIGHGEAGTWTVEFPDGVTIDKLNFVYEHVGISKDFTIEVLKNGDANYVSNITFTHFSSGWTVEYYENGKFVGSENRTGCSEINELEYIHPIHPNYDRMGIDVWCTEEILDKNNRSRFDENNGILHLVIADANFTCGNSINLSIKYKIKNFVNYDDKLSLFYVEHIEGFAIPKDSIYKYVMFNSKIIFPYSRNPKKGEEYIPFVAFPLNNTTYDRDMGVTIIQDDPLVLNFDKDIKNSNKLLILLMFFDKLEKPKLTLDEKVEIKLSEDKIYQYAKVQNNYENRNLSYCEPLAENPLRVFKIKRTRDEKGKLKDEEDLCYQLPPGDTRDIDLDSADFHKEYKGKLPRWLKYPFEGWEADDYSVIGSYMETDIPYIETDIPTDYKIYYKMEVYRTDTDLIELDTTKSFLELIPSENLRVKPGFLGLLGSGDFIGLSGYIDKPQKAYFNASSYRTRYYTPKIDLTINAPLYEAKVHYHLVFKNNTCFVWLPIVFGFLIPFFGFKLRRILNKKGVKISKDKYKYYGGIIGLYLGLLGLSNYLSFSNFEPIILFHKGLWIFGIMMLIIWEIDKRAF